MNEQMRERGGNIGPRVRSMRQSAGLTLQELGKRAGIAFSTISKIEKGAMSPTYELILKLASGLGVEVESLFAVDSVAVGSGRRSVTRAGEGVRQNTPSYVFEMLHTDLRNKQFVPIFATITARGIVNSDQLLGHAGEEFIFVVDGAVNLFTSEYECIRLEKGDSCYFDSRMGHSCTSADDGDAKVVWICSSVDAERRIQDQLNAAPKSRERITKASREAGVGN